MQLASRRLGSGRDTKENKGKKNRTNTFIFSEKRERKKGGNKKRKTNSERKKKGRANRCRYLSAEQDKKGKWGPQNPYLTSRTVQREPRRKERIISLRLVQSIVGGGREMERKAHDYLFPFPCPEQERGHPKSKGK